MKISRIVTVVALLLLVPVVAFSSGPGFMRVSLVKGDVQIKTPDEGEWGLALVNTPLEEGDQVWVPDGGRAELQLNGGTYLRLDQNTSLQVLSMDRDASQFYLPQGHAYVYFDGPRRSIIQIDTPDASMRAFTSSIFRIDTFDQYTDMAVFKGYVESENNAGTTRIQAGQLLSLGRDTEGEISALDPPDSWDRWNRRRDARIASRIDGSARFLPAELRVYSSDFDGNGRWTYVPEYGNVWTPSVAGDTEWSPYRQGRWILRNGESVWVADEPWGWTPYHYGRWSFVASIGWCWIPPRSGEVHWGPGYVGWVRTADYVAWVPLAPGETYYGRRDYGPHSVNITTVNINQVRVVNMYRNVNVANGVTVVRRDTFNTASPAHVRVDRDTIRRNIFVTNNISIGAPAVRPSRETRYPSARPISADKLPPLRIRNLRPQEIKHERPLVRERDRSVMAPGAPPKNLPVNRVETPRSPGKGRPEPRSLQPAEGRRPDSSPGLRPRAAQPQPRPADQVKPGSGAGPAAVGEQPQPHPGERRNTGMPGGSAPRSEQSQQQPAVRGRSESVPGTFPKTMRTPTVPVQGKPESRSGSAPAGGKPQTLPSERRNTGIPAGPAPRSEQPQQQPAVRERSESFPGTFPKTIRTPTMPVEQGKPETRTAPVPIPGGDKPQVRPSERRNTGMPGGPAPRGERQQMQPGELKRPDTPVDRTRKDDRQQDHSSERRKGGTTSDHTPKDGKDSPRSDDDSRNRK